MSLVAELEKAFLILLRPSAEAQVEGFKNIKTLLKAPDIDAALCECMTKSPDPGVRRYASTLLRRKVLKPKPWKKLSADLKQGIKQAVLLAFMNDPDKNVRNNLAHLIAAIAKHEVPKGQWPELMLLLNQSISSCNAADREIGLCALSIVVKRMGAALKPYFKDLLTLFSQTLLDTSSPAIPFYTIQTMSSMAQSIGSEEMSVFQAMLPSVMTVIKNLANADDIEKACEAIEIFEELLDSEVATIVPHLKPLTDLCLELAANEKIDDSLRVKALNTLRLLIEMKRKTIVKHNLVQPILDVVFPLICKPALDDCDEGNEMCLASVAAQTIDVMALHFPPERIIPPLMQFLEPTINSPLPNCRKAAYLALAVIAEGCSEHIRHKYLPSFVEVICKGMKDEDPIVRNAALYSLGQYAEYLQPEISKYASEVLPVLFEYLSQTFVQLQQGDAHVPTLKKTFYAVETFCENLEEGFSPFLPALMTCLMTFLTIEKPKSEFVKELAIRAIGSVANAAKEDFAPYFDSVMEKLKLFVSVTPSPNQSHPKENEDKLSLQLHSVEALSIIARNVGAATFMPVAHDCVKLGLHLIETVDDPCLRRAVYGLFGAVSTVLKSDMEPYLQTIIDRMMLTISCTEGVQAKYFDDAQTFRLFEDDEYYDDEEDDDMEEESLEDNDSSEEISGFTMENDFMDEKEGACFALKDLAAELGNTFIPHLSSCFSEILKQIDNPSPDVRRAVMYTLGQFLITYGEAFDPTAALETRSPLELKLGLFLPKVYLVAREDTEREVVLACLDTLEDVLNHLKQMTLSMSNITAEDHSGFMTYPSHKTLDDIMKLILDVYRQKLGCQDATGVEEEDTEEAEYDTMLFEYAGDLVTALVKILPSSEILKHLEKVMPFLHHKARPQNSVTEKSSSIGTLADFANSMQPKACDHPAFFPHMEKTFLSGMQDEHEEVRSNAVFGLGALIENVTDGCFDHYELYLERFSAMLAKEENSRAKDNLCAAMARMIVANVNRVPMKEVFPPFLQCLPLKEDLEESEAVFKCLIYLHSVQSPEFFQNLPQILTISAEVLANQKIDEDTETLVANLVTNIHAQFPNDFQNVLNNLLPPNAEALTKALVTSQARMAV